jgi:hypothetical protein
MLKYLLVAALVAPPTMAVAQESPPAQNSTEEALAQTLTETLSAEVQWRALAIADGQKIEVLQKQIVEAGKKPANGPHDGS